MYFENQTWIFWRKVVKKEDFLTQNQPKAEGGGVNYESRSFSTKTFVFDPPPLLECKFKLTEKLSVAEETEALC